MALDVDPLVVRGVWVRHSRHSSEPLPERVPAPDSRWQRGAIVNALYLADKPETAWAEWYRHLAELGVPPHQWLPTYLWRWRVDVEVAHLSTARRLERAGLVRPSPGRHTWPSFQEVGEDLHSEGWAGLIAPSAARPAGLVLCLFRSGGAPAGAKPIPPPEEIRQAPVPPWGMVT